MQDNTFILQDPSSNNSSLFSTWDINPTAKKGKRGRRRKETTDGNSENSHTPKKPGRKQVLTAPISKRQMQNREAQRLFRERKTRQQAELLTRIQELEQLHERSQKENCQLKDIAEALKKENEKLQFTLKTLKTDSKEEFGKFEFKSKIPSYFTSPNSSPSPSVSIGDTIPSPSFSPSDIVSSPIDRRDARSSSLIYMDEFDRESPVDLKKLSSMSPMLSLSQMNIDSQEINQHMEDAVPEANESTSPQATSGLSTSANPVELGADPVIKQEAKDEICKLQSTMLSLNANEGNLSIEYVDLLVEELHELCKEMKQKAMISSEPFEFEWPCDEIDNRLNEVNHFSQA